MQTELISLGHDVTLAPSPDRDLVLFNAWNLGPNMYNRPSRLAEVRARGRATILGRVVPAAFWNAMPRRGPALVHRVDGVAEEVRGQPGRADPTQFALNGLADLTIFQTEYCRTSFKDYGILPKNYSTVVNGVDSEIFYPPNEAPKNTNLRLVASSWSSNPRKGFEVLSLASEVLGVEVIFAGNWAESVPVRNVDVRGALRREDLAALLRSADGFLHAARNEPCSNSIIEALATGLPVIYRDSGGNKELASDHGVALGDDVAATIETFSRQRLALRERLLADRERFLAPVAVQAYLEAFERAIEIRTGGVGP
jgi:glycosyltransferase involved in cell wall biosynthesis